MKYFLHDTNAIDDEKVTLLYMEFGYEAVGLFYVILEKLGAQEKPINETVLKSQLNIRKRLQKQLNFMYKIGILSVRNGGVFNENILKFSEKYQIKKEKNRKRISEWRKNQEDTKNVTSYERVRNTPKVKLSKVKVSKVNNKEILKKKHLFKNSEYFNLEHFKKSIDEKYNIFDLDHYHQAAKDYSQSQNVIRADWLATIRSWINRDKAKGEGIMLKGSSGFVFNEEEFMKEDAKIQSKRK